MTALVADRRQAPSRAPRVRPGVPARRADRSTRPSHATLVPRVAAGAVRSCAVPRPAVRPRVSVAEGPLVVTSLTERGLALLLTLVALVAVACVAAVGVTAARVMTEPAVVTASR